MLGWGLKDVSLPKLFYNAWPFWGLLALLASTLGLNQIHAPHFACCVKTWFVRAMRVCLCLWSCGCSAEFPATPCFRASVQGDNFLCSGVHKEGPQEHQNGTPPIKFGLLLPCPLALRMKATPKWATRLGPLFWPNPWSLEDAAPQLPGGPTRQPPVKGLRSDYRFLVQNRPSAISLACLVDGRRPQDKRFQNIPFCRVTLMNRRIL